MVTPRSQAGTLRNRHRAAPWYVLLALCGLLLAHTGPESTTAHASLTPVPSARALLGEPGAGPAVRAVAEEPGAGLPARAAGGGPGAGHPAGPDAAPAGGHAVHHDWPGGAGHGNDHPHASCALGQPQPPPGPGLPTPSVLPSACRDGATVPAPTPRSLVPAAIGGFVVPIPYAAQSAVLRQ
ncbi:hypothetical protein [Streptomyces sp. NPDC101132]|uniref:hypothetical protein n=1 Tax=Streptomyces sp. NPDC101132 TaxID=3366110 RepID=UPI00381D5122